MQRLSPAGSGGMGGWHPWTRRRWEGRLADHGWRWRLPRLGDRPPRGADGESRRSAMPLEHPGRGVCATVGAERCPPRSSGLPGPLRPRMTVGDGRRQDDHEPVTGAWWGGRGRRQTREGS
jgi:hypothetical protein